MWQDSPPLNEAGQSSMPVEDTTVVLQDKVNTLFAGLTDGDITRTDLIRVWTDLGVPVVKAIVLILAVLFVAGWLARVTTRVAKKAKIEITLARFFGNIVRYVVLVLGALAVLDTFGIKTTSFAAVLAAVGFAIGMALSGALGNVASGVLLLIFRPFKVGDVVAAGGVTGKVEELGLFTTAFDTPDNRRIIVPNNSIFGSTIENITHHSTRRVDVAVGTAYSACLEETKRVLLEAASGVEGINPSPEPVVYLNALGDSSISWSVRVWVATSEYWAVKERLTFAVKNALDAARISIPYPQMDVHLQKSD